MTTTTATPTVPTTVYLNEAPASFLGFNRAAPARLRAAERLCQPFREIERGGTADIMFEQIVELGLKARVSLSFAIFAFEIEDQRHQRFGDITAAVIAEVATFIGLIAE